MLDPTGKIHGAYHHRFHFSVGQKHLRHFEGFADAVFCGGKREGGSAEIPKGSNPACHDIADKACVLIDQGGEVQAVLGPVLKNGSLFRRKRYPGAFQCGRQLPCQVHATTKFMQGELGIHGDQYGDISAGFHFRILQRCVCNFEHEQLLGDRLVGVVGRDLEIKEIHLETGEISTLGDAVDPILAQQL